MAIVPESASAAGARAKAAADGSGGRDGESGETVHGDRGRHAVRGDRIRVAITPIIPDCVQRRGVHRDAAGLEAGADQRDVALEPAGDRRAGRGADREHGGRERGSASWRASSASSSASRRRACGTPARPRDRAGAAAAPSAAPASRPGGCAVSPARRERSTSTWVAPSASAARNGIAADSPASRSRRPSSSTGGPASSGSAAEARSASRSDGCVGDPAVQVDGGARRRRRSRADAARSRSASTAANRPGESCS